MFGDIRINIREQHSTAVGCQKVQNYTDSIDDSIGGSHPVFPLTIHYFRTSTEISQQENSHLLYTDGLKPRFYRNDGKDLQDIRNVWKTGWNDCETTGSMGPNWDDELQVACDKL